MTRFYTLICLFLCLSATLSAQDAVFSQFYTAPIRLNPALAGISRAPRVALNYRAQHTKYPSAFTTMAASYEQPVEGTPSGFGMRVMRDQQLEGVYNNTEVSLVYSYDVKFDDDFRARLGLSAGLFSTALDFGALTFGDVLSPIDGAAGGELTEEELSRVSNTAADFGAGIVIHTRDYYFGVSMDHLNTPNENVFVLADGVYAGRPQRLTVTGGAEFTIKSLSSAKRPSFLAPNFLYSSQGRFRQLNVGTYVNYGVFAIGGWYRHAFENADSFIGAVSFRKDILRVGFSYDAVISGLRTVPGGLGSTLEASVMIDFGESKKLAKKRFSERYRNCFKMFQ